MPLDPTRLDELFVHAPEKKYQGIQSHSRYLTMRDGVQIAVDVLLPAGLEPDDRIPAVLTMTRYWRSFELRMPEERNKAPIAPREALADDLVPRGFAMVIVDARGSGASTGVSRYPFMAEELADYGEVAGWAVTQPWCNGSVGAVGLSYEGTTAQLLAATGNPAVTAVIPQQLEFDLFTDIICPGGILNKAFMEAWSEGNTKLDSNRLPRWFPIPWFVRWLLKGVRPVDDDRPSLAVLSRAMADHQANTDIFAAASSVTYRDDPFGDTGVTIDDFSVFSHKAAIEASGCPIFIWGSWLDNGTADTVIRTFNTFDNPQIAIIGGWSHEMTTQGSPYQKPKSKPDPAQAQGWEAVAQFFGQTLKQDRPPRQKILFYYTLGAETWRQTGVFPLPGTNMETWYFQAGHGLSPELPDTDDGADVYEVDFNATSGVYNRWYTGLARPVIYPDRAAEDRRLLTYTSSPLEHDMEITGYPAVSLHLSSTADDGAFIVYLEDVDEAGVVRYITEGLLRGIHRRLSDEQPPYFTAVPYRTFNRADAGPLPPGETVELIFGMLPTSVLVRRGHRIRVAIAGADKDTFARIPLQGTPTLQISRSRLLASCIRLPVIGK